MIETLRFTGLTFPENDQEYDPTWPDQHYFIAFTPEPYTTTLPYDIDGTGNIRAVVVSGLSNDGGFFRFTPTPNVQVTIESWEVTGETRTVRKPIKGGVGEFPAYTYVDGLLIHQEGTIAAGGRPDESFLVWIMRQFFFRALMGNDPANPPDQQLKMGTLTMEMTGWGTTASVDVALDAFPDIPILASQPAKCPYLINWILFDPYMTADDGSGDIFYL